MKDNRGFSLVELLIVVAIMGIMSGFVFIGLPLMTGQKARECANNMSSALGKEKNYALTRSGTIDCYMELLSDTGGYHVKYYIPKSAVVDGSDPDNDWVLAEEQTIGSGQVNVTCDFDDGSSMAVVSGHSLKLVYRRTDGALKYALQGDGTTVGVEANGGLPGTVLQCTGITFDRGKKYQIVLYPATGKHELSRVN